MRGEDRPDLHSLQHIGQTILHVEFPPSVVDGSHHRQVEGDDPVGERTHRHLRLEVPELAAVVADGAVIVPDQASLLLVLPGRQ